MLECYISDLKTAASEKQRVKMFQQNHPEYFRLNLVVFYSPHEVRNKILKTKANSKTESGCVPQRENKNNLHDASLMVALQQRYNQINKGSASCWIHSVQKAAGQTKRSAQKHQGSLTNKAPLRNQK